MTKASLPEAYLLFQRPGVGNPVTFRPGIVGVEQNIDTAVTLGEQGFVLEHGRIVESGNIKRLHDDGVLEERLAL